MKNEIFIIINTTIIYTIITIIAVSIYNTRKNRKINTIIKSLEEINRGNYKINLDEMEEGKLAILKSEIYKTTVMLKEQAENSQKDKVKLKDSLSDISHQLKTPITSIMIMLDNISDNPDMPQDIREDFIKEIKMEITNISFLIQSILKLSKLDSNTVEYIDKQIKASELVNNSIKKLLPLCDLKNVKIKVEIKQDSVLNCDEMWQTEAISNIIKNSIEHSNEGDSVHIIIDKNNVYTDIKISDNGSGISEKDLPHIFERFYKGKNSDTNSIGIGLALSKAIINKGNGTVTAQSEEGKGTTFEIKYVLLGTFPFGRFCPIGDTSEILNVGQWGRS